MKKMQAPNDWENIAAEYLTSTPGALQPFNFAPAYIMQVPHKYKNNHQKKKQAQA